MRNLDYNFVLVIHKRGNQIEETESTTRLRTYILLYWMIRCRYIDISKDESELRF